MTGTGDFSVNLPTFEGPLDLLLFLVKKNDMDIHDISISVITEEYLNYIELLDQFNIDYASGFLFMAATLANIKSKMLLPVNAQSDEPPEEDPRLEIVRPLEAYLELKSAGASLMKSPVLGRDLFTRPPADNTLEDTSDRILPITLYSLLKTYKNLSEKQYEPHHVSMEKERVTVKEKIDKLIRILKRKRIAGFSDLLEDNMESANIIITFLALLEMSKLKLVSLYQPDPSETITTELL